MTGRNLNNNRAHVISRLDLAKYFFQQVVSCAKVHVMVAGKLDCVLFMTMTTPA